MAKKTTQTTTGRKRLTAEQEFQIMKLVFDKFLWLGFGLMAFWLYRILTDVLEAIAWLIAGIVVLLLFTWIVVKEYEIISK